MDTEAQELRRASLRAFNPGTRKSVNWARRRPVSPDGGTQPDDEDASDADGTGATAGYGGSDGDWRDGAISPLDSAMDLDVSTLHYSVASSSTAGGGGGAGGYGSRHGNGRISQGGGLSRSVSAMTGAGGSSHAPEAWESSLGYDRPSSRGGNYRVSSAGTNYASGYGPAGGAPHPGVMGTSRPGTAGDPYGYTHGDRGPGPGSGVPMPPGSPSKVGLSSRQRAMVDAAQVGTFRFARIKRPAPSAANYAAGPNMLQLEGYEDNTVAQLVLPGVFHERAAAGGGAAAAAAAAAAGVRTSGMRVAGSFAVAASAFQSPMAPYRRTAPPLPAANHRTSCAGLEAIPGAAGGGGGGGAFPPQPSNASLATAILQELNAPYVAAAAAAGGGGGGGSVAVGSYGARDLSGGMAAPPAGLVAVAGRFEERSVVSESVSPVLPIGATRTEVLANFVRPGRGVLQQPGLQRTPMFLEPEVSDAEALLCGAGSGVGPGGGADAVDPAAASSALLDADLAPLLREVAETNVRPAVRAALSKLDDRAIKQLFAATSRRVEHLPCTPVSLSSGGGLLLPLPGPKGVSGYRVNVKGQVTPSKKAGGHFFRDGKTSGPGSGPGLGIPGRTTPLGLLPVATPEIPNMQQLLEQDPEALSPKTRALLMAHAPRGTRDYIEATERSSVGSSGGVAAGAAAGGGVGSGSGIRRGHTPRSGSSPRRRSASGDTHGRSGGGGGSPPHSAHQSFSSPHPQLHPHGSAHPHPHPNPQGHLHSHPHPHLHPDQGSPMSHPHSNSHSHSHQGPSQRRYDSQESSQSYDLRHASGALPRQSTIDSRADAMSHPDPRFSTPAGTAAGEAGRSPLEGETMSAITPPLPGAAHERTIGAGVGRASPRHDLRFKLGTDASSESLTAGGGGGGGGAEHGGSSGGAPPAASTGAGPMGGPAAPHVPLRSNGGNISDRSANGRSNSNSGAGLSMDDPLEARRFRLGMLMEDVETQQVPDEELSRYIPLDGLGRGMPFQPPADPALTASSPATTAAAAANNAAAATAAGGITAASLADRRAAAAAAAAAAGGAGSGSGVDTMTSRLSSAAPSSTKLTVSGYAADVAEPPMAVAAVATAAAAGGGTQSGTAADAEMATEGVGGAAGGAAGAGGGPSEGGIWSWAGRMGGADDSPDDEEDEEDRLVTDEELGLLTLDQTLAQLGPRPHSSDAIFARMQYLVKRKAALAERRAAREEEARRRAEEEASRYHEVPLGTEDVNDELAGPLRSGLRGAVLRMRRHGEAGRENMLMQSGFHHWPSSRYRSEPHPGGLHGAPGRDRASRDTLAPPELTSEPSTARHLRFMHQSRARGAYGAHHLSYAYGAGRSNSGTSSAFGDSGAGRSGSPSYGLYNTMPYHSAHLTHHHGYMPRHAETHAAGITVAGVGDGPAGRSAPRSRSVSPAMERNRVAWSNQRRNSSRGSMGGGVGFDEEKGPAGSATFEYESEEQRQKLAPVLETWEIIESKDSQLAALGAFKEALQPASARPPPPDMKPFTPVEGEPVRVTDQQVSRRLAQAVETGSPILDLDFGPRLTRGDLGVVYAALKGLAPNAVVGLRAVSGVMTSSAVDGLTALVRARPAIEELELRNNQSLGPAALNRLAPLLHPSARCRLRVIDLSGCPVRDAGFAALAGHLAENKSLQTLLLSGCGLEDGSLTVLYQSLALNTALRLLDLSQNRFSEVGMSVLCKDLEENRSLTRLNLAHCSLTDTSAPPLARVLALHPTLTSLDVAHNCLGWRAGRALAEGLMPEPVNPVLLQQLHQQHPHTHTHPGGHGHGHHVHLHPHFAGGTRPGERGPQRPVLRSLVLDGNPLGQAGAIAMMRLLQVNSTLTDLSLANVTLSPIPGEPLELDPAHPNGHYALDLANPEHRKAATTLVSLWHSSGGSSWLSATLNGEPLHMPRAAAGCVNGNPSGSGTAGGGGGGWPDWVRPHLRWPEAMPAEGHLVVAVRNNASLDPSLLQTQSAPLPVPPAAAAAVAAAAAAAQAAAAAGGGDVGRNSRDVSGDGGGVGIPAPPVVRPPVVLSPTLLSCLIRAIEGPAGSEVWKAQLLTLATKVSFVTAEQAGRLLVHLRYRSERADAAATLLAATPDLHRVPWALKAFARFGPDDMAELLQELSLAPLLPLRTRVINGWDSCCSGHVRLDLAQQSHRLLAILLVQIAHRDSGAPRWSTPQAAAPAEDLFGATTARLGDATSCMRNITFSGSPLGHSVIYLSSANIPTRGVIDTHFVNVRPRTHVDYPGRERERERRQAPSFLSGKLSLPSPPGSGTLSPAPTFGGGPTHTATTTTTTTTQQTSAGTNGTGSGASASGTTALPSATSGAASAAAAPPHAASSTVSGAVVAAESMRMAATALSQSVALNAVVTKRNWWQQYLGPWEALFGEALLRLGLPHSHPSLAGWRLVSTMWKGQYRSFSTKLHLEIQLRHDGYVPPQPRRRSTHQGGESEGGEGGGGKGGGKGGKKDKGKVAGGKKGAGDIEPEGRKGGADGGKKGKAGGKKGGRRGDADGGGGGPWGPGVDPATARQLSALELKARQLAPLMIDLACGISLSSYQVLHFLRLIPDFDLRIKVLVALWPAIWDRGNVLDLILDLDHPVAVPPPPRKVPTDGLASLSSYTAWGLPVPGARGGDPRRSTTSGSTAPGSPVKHPAEGPSGTRAGAGPGGAQSPALRPRSPGPESLLVRPKGFVPSPHTGDELLLRVASSVGWRSLLLCWANPGALMGRTLHLHMGAIDQLQAVASICRFADRCYRLTGRQVVTGLACDGQPQDPEEAAEVAGGLWQLILSRTVLCLDRPEYGTVSLQLDGITQEAQRAVAAVTIQAVWRGHVVRQALYRATVASAGGHRWRRCVRLARYLRRLALMRTLAADLDISRAQSEMERGYLRMLYGPNAA